MMPTTNPRVVEIARSLGLKPEEINAGEASDLYVIAHPWGNYAREAYRVADVMCAVIERLCPDGLAGNGKAEQGGEDDGA